jgi:type II secretory ATPase GspE/PulE/Tfp pilus assembly ATPase PilB-like protein
LYEILEVSDAIRALIMKRANAGDIESLAMQEGMTTMLEDGLRKVTEGVTTVEEVLRVVKT